MEQEKDLKDKKTGKEKKAKKKINGYILGMVYLFILLFVGLAGYLCYFTWKEAPELVNSPYNGRLEKLNETCIRGEILSADGKALAVSRIDEDGEERKHLFTVGGHVHWLSHYGKQFEGSPQN